MRRICNIVIDLLDIVPCFWQGTICYKSALISSGAVCAVMSGGNFLSFSGCYPKNMFLSGAVWSEITGAVCSEFTGAVCSVIVTRILGILLIIAGIAYMIASFIALLFPGYQSFVNQPTLLIVAVGEISIMLWLLIKGIKNNIPTIDK